MIHLLATLSRALGVPRWERVFYAASSMGSHRPTRAGLRIGQPGSVACAAIEHALRRQRFGVGTCRPRPLFLLDAPAG